MYGGMGAMQGQQGAQIGQSLGQMSQDPNAVQGYMNPYLQASLNPQLAEVQRQYDITGQQEQGAAARAGAFGGSREALMAAENQRNANLAKNQMIGQGYNTAFQNAQQQMQAANQAALAGNQQALSGYGMGLQGAGQAGQQAMQGYGMGLQGASQAGQMGISGAQAGLAGVGAQQAGYGQAGQAGTNLANIGGQQLQAQQGIYGLQNQIGAQQQAQQQDIINQQIQNYAVAQQYPQQQLAFMNAMLRGLPMQSGSTQMYQAAPSPISQAAGLGTAGIAGLGLYNTMSNKAGGVIKKYASGGIADIDRKVLLAPDKYSVQQIQQGMKDGVINKMVGDPILADKIKEQQMAKTAPTQPQPTIDQQINQQAAQLSQAAPPPMPQGLPAAQSNLPTFNAYDGGIVAFGVGGDTNGGGAAFYPKANPAAIDPNAPSLGSRIMNWLIPEYKTDADYDDQDVGTAIKENINKPKKDDWEKVDRNKLSAPKAPAAPAAPAPTLPAAPDGIADLAKSQKSDITDLKDLILGLREDPDKALKQSALLSAIKGGFKTAAGTSPYAMSNIGTGGDAFAEELGKGIDRIQTNKQQQVGQLVALGLKGAELDNELQKLGITRDYYKMHAPLFASQAQYYDARALHPPGTGAGASLGSINAKDYWALKDKYATLSQNPKADPTFFATLPKDVKDALGTKVGSPSYIRGIEAVQDIVKKRMGQDIAEARILGAKKAPISMLSDLD